MQQKPAISLPGLTLDQRRVLTRIYQTHYEPMLVRAYAILQNRQDAEDAVQEAFFGVCQHAAQFAGLDEQEIAPLLYTCVRNAAINIYRRKKRRLALISDADDLDQNICSYDDVPEVILGQKERATTLREAVEQLEPMYRQVIVLKYYGHKSNSEIALALGIERNTVNGRIFRAKKILRNILENKGKEN